ncbi:MAG: transketolase, partial [Desulfobacterales bacterium]|nr:transketolase [Desulfobacterales bacterium]
LKSIKNAKEETEKPSMILLRTHIAYGSPNKQDSPEAHGAPLGKDEVKLTKINLGCPEDVCFCAPESIFEITKKCIEKGAESEKSWQKAFDSYSKDYPLLSGQLKEAISGTLPNGWDKDLPDFSNTKDIATRSASGKIINAIAKNIPYLIGGSADLAPSNMTIIESSHDFQKPTYTGRNIRFGVREHSMGAILSGITLHKGLRAYGGTFLVFVDYMRPSVRLASLMKLPVIYVLTHDSIAVGEDGPTHQPIEHIASLRTIPNLTVIRPADATETVEAWKIAMQAKDTPVALILTRQKLPILHRSKYPPASLVKNGAYILADSNNNLDLIFIATGSEVHLALSAREILLKENISVRVVSMPSWELFEKMDIEYKNKVLPPNVTNRIAIEAGSPMGWERYVGINGGIIGINRFGQSAPGDLVMERFGFSSENIVKTAKKLLIK